MPAINSTATERAPASFVWTGTHPDLLHHLLMADLNRHDLASRMGLASIGVAILVMAIKYAAYAVTGSVALFSDALESIVNLLTAILTVMAIRIGSRPADRHHQFGHHKIEYFAAVIEGVLITVAALLILREAIDALRTPRTINAPVAGLLISGVATIINAAWAWALIKWGRVWRSPALTADGFHILSDVATSIGVLAGLVLATITGLPWLDPLLAMAVAIHILWIGYRIVVGSASSLMDRAVATEVAKHIQTVVAANASGALEFHDIRTRVAGPATFIEFHLVVPGTMTVDEAHVICDRIETALEAEIEGAEVLIHVEPEHKAKRSGIIID